MQPEFSVEEFIEQAWAQGGEGKAKAPTSSDQRADAGPFSLFPPPSTYLP